MYKYKMIMKKILLGLVMLVTAATMNAQIELECTIDGAVQYDEIFYIYSPYKMYGMNDMYIVEDGNGKFNIYYENGEFYKSCISLADGFPRGNKTKLWIVAKNIFTNDNRVCFVYVSGIGYEETAIVKIVDEDNSVISILPIHAGAPYCDFRKMKSGYKLLLTVLDEGTYQFKTNIYSLPGNGEAATSVENVPAKVKRNAYPNPASDLVTLPYEANGATSMKIYDMQGKLVERKFLDKSKQELQLNVKDYPSGMYFFEVNGESNSFIVK